MPVICISSSEKDSGKTAILSGIVKESLDRGIKTYVGELENDEIVEHKILNGFNIVIGNYNVITLSSVYHMNK